MALLILETLRLLLVGSFLGQLELRFESFGNEVEVVDHAIRDAFVCYIVHRAVHRPLALRFFDYPRVEGLIQSALAEGQRDAVYLVYGIVAPEYSVRLHRTSWGTFFRF